MSNLIDLVNEQHLSPNVKKFPKFTPGDTIGVYVRIKEGEKSRLQLFQGVVISMNKKNSINGSFTVRKTSAGIGVERVFPFHGPNVDSIKLIQKGKARRAKFYYLRKRSGKSARIDIDYDKADSPSEAVSSSSVSATPSSSPTSGQEKVVSKSKA